MTKELFPSQQAPGLSEVPGARLLDLVAVMDRLRSECPWDAKQTHRSLATYLVEETYEVLEALEVDDGSLCEELGDLLLQVIFHARIAQDQEHSWSIDDVAEEIITKLIRRHPHVFADGDASTPEQVSTQWAKIKHAEKKRTSVVDGVPLAQPALSLVAKLLHRSRRGDITARPGQDPIALAELTSSEKVGEALFSIAAAATDNGIDPEQALRDTARDYIADVRAQEAHQH